MDRIEIRDLEVFANHGVFNEEKILGQKFVLDIFLYMNLKEASNDDNLEKSISYAEVCEEVSEFFTKNTYDLIETAADKTISYLLIKYPLLCRCEIILKKPFAPIKRTVKYAGVSMSRSRHEVYLSIGSNMGDKKANLLEAINRLESFKEIKVEKVSNFVTTEPWGYKQQDEFLNGAIKLSTIFEPKELMKVLLSIEKDMKRIRKIKWGPRIIDLDIIFFDDLVLSDDFITIPHPRMEERLFVLEPLSEIAPNFVHPLIHKRVFRLMEDLK